MDSLRRDLLTKSKLAVWSIVAVSLACIVFTIYTQLANIAPDGEGVLRYANQPGESKKLTPKEHVRTPDQTFLTFPEWFLVHSPKEYADFLKAGNSPMEFPFFRHVGQFWQSYRHVAPIANHYFPYNSEYHVMIVVIGVSTTIEYGLKGAYETIIGRSFEKISTSSPEDKYFARYAQEYVDFIDVEPWYKFDFISRLKTLWTEVPFGFTTFLRSLERRYLLTTELLIKAVYGWLIGLGSVAYFDASKPTTAVVVQDSPNLEKVAGSKIAWQSLDESRFKMALLPRYQGFTDASLQLAKGGIDFVEIAGNRGVILVSAIVPVQWHSEGELSELLFMQPIITKSEKKRVVLMSRVSDLSHVLRDLIAQGSVIEHVYDF